MRSRGRSDRTIETLSQRTELKLLRLTDEQEARAQELEALDEFGMAKQVRDCGSGRFGDRTCKSRRCPRCARAHAKANAEKIKRALALTKKELLVLFTLRSRLLGDGGHPRRTCFSCPCTPGSRCRRARRGRGPQGMGSADFVRDVQRRRSDQEWQRSRRVRGEVRDVGTCAWRPGSWLAGDRDESNPGTPLAHRMEPGTTSTAAPSVPTSPETVPPRYLCTKWRRMVPSPCPSHPQFLTERSLRRRARPARAGRMSLA
jgi:hypothetical protein